MKKLGKKSRSNLIFSLVMLVVCGLLCLIPEAFTNPSSAIPRERVRIESVDNTQLYPLGIVYSGSQNCEVTVLTGEYAGESAMAYNYQNSALDKDKLFEAGDTAYAMVQMGANGLTVTLIDHYRAGVEGWIFAALALALIAVGGAVGCGALVSLVSSVVMVWKLLIPLLLRGVDPILASFVTVLVLTVIIDLLVAGWTKKCLVALTGSLMGTLLTCVLAIIFTNVLKLDGGDTPYIVPLLSQSAMTIDPKALFIGMVFIANAGALMDLSMDVAISCEEIVYHRPDITRGALLKSGISNRPRRAGHADHHADAGLFRQLPVHADVLCRAGHAGDGRAQPQVRLQPADERPGGQLWPGGGDADDRPRRLRALHAPGPQGTGSGGSAGSVKLKDTPTEGSAPSARPLTNPCVQAQAQG